MKINDENQQELLNIKPQFNFIYELFMPTGRKIKNTLAITIIFFVITILVQNYNVDNLVKLSDGFVDSSKILNYLLVFCYGITIISFVKLIFHVVFQKLQYDNIRYLFYEDHMIYIDDFLNQHKKNIQYNNIKEVELRRTILDRILRFGIIVIYTNAENDRSNGLVIYGIKTPEVYYEKIDNLVHKKKMYEYEKKEHNVEYNNEKETSEINEIERSEEAFKKSLGNINKE